MRIIFLSELGDILFCMAIRINAKKTQSKHI